MRARTFEMFMCRTTHCSSKLRYINSIAYRIVYVYAISSTLSDHKFCASQSRTHFVWITNRLCSHIMNSAAFSECNVVISMFFIRRIFSFEFFFRSAFFSHKFVYASVCTDHLRNSKQEKYAVLERRTITSRARMFVRVRFLRFLLLVRLFAHCLWLSVSPEFMLSVNNLISSYFSAS